MRGRERVRGTAAVAAGGAREPLRRGEGVGARRRGGLMWLVTLVALLALLTGGVGEARGQVPRRTPAFQAVSVVREGEQVVYRYRLVGYAPAGRRVSEVLLRIVAPKRVVPTRYRGMEAEPPVLLGSRGMFLGDWIAKHIAVEDSGHAPLFVGTPSRWSAALYRQGFVSWGADVYPRGPSWGVPRGQSLEGFELRSPAVPALRQYYAPVERELFPEDGVGPDVDSTWTVHTGVVPAPGWEARDVDAGYLLAQVNTACAWRLVENCGRYLRLADGVRFAEGRGDRARLAAAIGELQGQLAMDRVSAESARWVLGEVGRAILGRANPPAGAGGGSRGVEARGAGRR